LVCAKCCVRNCLHNPLHAIEVSHQAFMLYLSTHSLHRNGQANVMSRRHWPSNMAWTHHRLFLFKSKTCTSKPYHSPHEQPSPRRTRLL
jgi:hypothetical protein